MELPKLDTERLVRMVDWATTADNWRQQSWALMNDGEITDELYQLYIEEEDANDSQFLRVGTAFDKRLAEMEKSECGSSYCIAGETVHDAGYRMLFNTDMEATNCLLQVPTDAVDDKGRTVWVDHPDAKPECIPDVASRLLGLSKTESTMLFDGENGVESLKGFINLFHTRRGLPEPYPEEQWLEAELIKEATAVFETEEMAEDAMATIAAELNDGGFHVIVGGIIGI